MATEINAICTIDEQGVTICYPPIDSPGTGGITGTGVVNHLLRVETVDGTDILTVVSGDIIEDADTITATKQGASGGGITWKTKVTGSSDYSSISVEADSGSGVFGSLKSFVNGVGLSEFYVEDAEAYIRSITINGTAGYLTIDPDGKLGVGTGGGTIQGTIQDSQVAFGNGADTIQGSDNLKYESETLKVTAGAGTSTGWGNVQHIVSSDGSEAGIELTNTGVGGSSWSLIATSNSSGIGGGKLSLGNAENSRNYFQIDEPNQTIDFEALYGFRVKSDNIYFNSGNYIDGLFKIAGEAGIVSIGDTDPDHNGTRIVLNDTDQSIVINSTIFISTIVGGTYDITVGGDILVNLNALDSAIFGSPNTWFSGIRAGTGGQTDIGDWNGSGNFTHILIDDAAQTITHNADNGNIFSNKVLVDTVNDLADTPVFDFITGARTAYTNTGVDVAINFKDLGASIADATGGAIQDAEARAAINDLLAQIRAVAPFITQ